MATLATDADLVRLDPSLVRDVQWSSQVRLRATGTIFGTTLTITPVDLDAEQAGIGTGDVVVVGGVALEVLDRTTPTELAVSRIRASDDDPALDTPPMIDASVVFHSFSPQREAAHDRVIDELGIRHVGALEPARLRRYESLIALMIIHGIASRASGEAGCPEWIAAEVRHERDRLAISVDTDGDGVADALRVGFVIVGKRW